MTPSPTIATTRPSAWRRWITSRLLRRQDLGDRPRRSRPRPRRPRRCSRLSPVSSSGVRPELARGSRPRRRDGGLIVSETTKTASHPAVPRRRRRQSLRRPPPPSCARASSAGSVRPRSSSRPARPAMTRIGLRRSPRLRDPRGCESSRRHGSEPRPRGSSGDRPRDRVLGGGLEGADEPERLVGGRLRPRDRSLAAPSRPVVTVPVLSSTIVSTRRVDSRTSGPLIRRPSCAPRPVPTSRAVGVARPSAQGQAMISTATAAVNAYAVLTPAAEPEAERRGREGDDDRDEHAGDAIGEALHRRLAGLGRGDEAGDLRERGVGADARRARRRGGRRR